MQALGHTTICQAGLGPTYIEAVGLGNSACPEDLPSRVDREPLDTAHAR